MRSDQFNGFQYETYFSLSFPLNITKFRISKFFHSLLTVKHCIEICAVSSQNHFMSQDFRSSNFQSDITQLTNLSHFVHCSENREYVTSIFKVHLSIMANIVPTSGQVFHHLNRLLSMIIIGVGSILFGLKIF